MRKGDIIELRTIDKRGFISFRRFKIDDARAAKKQLKTAGYQSDGYNSYFCSHQYDKKEIK